MYMTDGNFTGSPQSLEKRRQRAKLISAGAIEMLNHVMSKIFVCKDMEVLRVLLKAGKCLHEIVRFFCCDDTKITPGHKIEYETIYNPDYLKAMQMDCFRVVADIMFLFGKMKSYIDTIEDEHRAIQVIRIALVTSRYLQSFVVGNADFHAKPPPPYKRHNRKRSVWQY